MRLTVGAMERQLRKILLAPETSLEFHHLKGTFAGEAKLQTRQIKLNPFNGGITETVIHELIHIGYEGELQRWGALEEPIVEALEDAVVRYVNRNPKRRSWWHQKIQEKLPES